MNETTLTAEARRVVAENVRRLRTASQRSVDEISQKANVGRAYWYQIEAQDGNPTLEILGRVARALGVTVQDLFSAPAPVVFSQSLIPKQSKSKRRKAS